ncbi:MAG TPA: hypothetical protein VLE53_15820 [Gemmatimonadaceae bacterium]|nr:hypothetical protein [Gemmatimonadaceae bacterium]
MARRFVGGVWRAALALAGAVMLSTEARGQSVPLDSVAAADTSLRHAVRLHSGSVLLGRIVAITPDSVRIELEGGGSLAVPRAAVRNVDQFSAARLRNGRYWFENPHATRLLFSATAFPLGTGNGYYANTWLFFNTFATGLTDRVSVGVGFSLFPGADFSDNIFWVLPKVTVIDAPRAKVALGAFAGVLPVGGDGDGFGDRHTSAGILYGVGSTGSTDSNLSLGLGWGYVGAQLADRPIVMVGGQGRVLRRLALITENWFIPVDGRAEGIMSAGLRFLSEGVSADIAFVRPTDVPVYWPWVGIAFRF